MSDMSASFDAGLLEVKQQITKLELELNSKIANLETEVRVVKHDFVNLKDMINGVGTRVDKMEERIAGKIDALSEKLATVNLKQERGAGFFAGVGAIITLAGGILLAVAKMLFVR